LAPGRDCPQVSQSRVVERGSWAPSDRPAANVQVTSLNPAVMPEQALPAGMNTLQSNGQSATGTKAPAGTYLLRVTPWADDGSKPLAVTVLRR